MRLASTGPEPDDGGAGWIVVALAILAILGVAGWAALGCYKPGPNPPPCVNIMDCDDPTAPPWPPPLMTKTDGGVDR